MSPNGARDRIEQIGGARTEPRGCSAAMACFSTRCNLHQAPPGGSLLSRAPISGATPFDSKLNACPKAFRLCSENALDGASAAYLQVDPLNGLFVYVIQRQRSYGFIWCQALTIVSRHERRRNRAQAVSLPGKWKAFGASPTERGEAGRGNRGSGLNIQQILVIPGVACGRFRPSFGVPALAAWRHTLSWNHGKNQSRWMLRIVIDGLFRDK